MLGVVALPGLGQEFLDRAIGHANERLVGTLGANVLIDPVDAGRAGRGIRAGDRRPPLRLDRDQRVDRLRLSCSPALTWGGFPGASIDDVGSGLGVVHNALLLDRVERSVVRGPFRPFPRSVSALGRPGTFSVLPKPPWFVTSRTGAAVSEGFTRFQMTHDWIGLRQDAAAGIPRMSPAGGDLAADYIIVGAGSAGAALAARLSEDPTVSVLLLEAGGRDKALELHVPAAFSKLFRGAYDWSYDTVPQRELDGRTIFWPRGKTLGGSSSLNAMMWIRGFAADYDEWADAAGPTWSWDALVPYFRRVERTADPVRRDAGRRRTAERRASA